jgi:hypothetical protein
VTVGSFQITMEQPPLPPASFTFTAAPTSFDGLPAADVKAAFAAQASVFGKQTLTITSAGDLAPTSPAPGDVSSIDAGKLHDILLYLEYTIAPG